jgi:hypothetical protein
MNSLNFKEWLSKTSPEGGGEIWDNRSNADLNFGRTGAKSKNVSPDKAGQVEIDPEKLFFGISKKRNHKLDIEKNSNIGGNDENNYV